MINFIPPDPEILFRSLGMGVFSAEMISQTDVGHSIGVFMKSAEKIGIKVKSVTPDPLMEGKVFIVGEHGMLPCTLEIRHLLDDMDSIVRASENDELLNARLQMIKEFIR